jgi:hypothetical protein
VSLVTSSNHTKGRATCTTALASNGPNAGTGYLVGAVVTGSYHRDSSLDDGVVVLARPLASRLVAGAGALRLSKSAGSLAGTAGSTASVGFTATYNAARTTLHGTVSALVVHAGHVYLVRVGVPTTVGGTPPKAKFVGVAVLSDITDPHAASVLSSSARLTMTLTDGGAHGVDKLAITLRKSSGKLLFSSRWSGSATVPQKVARGSLVVR